MAKGERLEERFDEFLTVDQLAKVFKLTPVTIYRMVSRGELPCYTFGRVKRFRSHDVENFIRSCRMQVSSGQRRRHSAR